MNPQDPGRESAAYKAAGLTIMPNRFDKIRKGSKSRQESNPQSPERGNKAGTLDKYTAKQPLETQALFPLSYAT